MRSNIQLFWFVAIMLGMVFIEGFYIAAFWVVLGFLVLF